MIKDSKELNFDQEVYFIVPHYITAKPNTSHSEGIRKTLAKITINKGKVCSMTKTTVNIGCISMSSYNSLDYFNVELKYITLDYKELLEFIPMIGMTTIEKSKS